ncbi:MAG: UV damage endonuclease UvsE [Chloroflexi bacterium]|nr:UV damage endonuclease UvsE [Chloroflexota bacterium]
MARLGFSVRVYGRVELTSYTPADAHSHAPLSVQLAHLHDVLRFLHDSGIKMYRMHTGLAPEPGGALAAALRQIETCSGQLQTLAQLARADDLRLSFHPYSRVVLNSPNEEQAADSAAILSVLAALLDALAAGPEAVIVLHVGGVYDDPATSAERFVRRYELLPAPVRARIVLENDDQRYAYGDVRAIHARCGVPLVLDLLHHQVLNPAAEPWTDTLAHALGTWPAGVRPKVHYATPRTELRTLPGTRRIKTPSWTEHSDYINPFAFVDWARAASRLPEFDIMLESKARDLALLQLRRDLARFAPDLASLWR